MKTIKLLIWLIVFSLLAGTVFPFYVAAENSTEEILKELIIVGEEAELFCYTVEEIFSDSSSHKTETAMWAYAMERGYVTEPPEQWVELNGSLYYPYASKMDSIAKWQTEVARLYSEDFLGFTDPSPTHYEEPLIVEKDGRTYGTTYDKEGRGFFVWKDANLIYYSGERAVLSSNVLMATPEDLVPSGEIKTISFIKTENGWRVSGGSYWEFHHPKYIDQIDPPKTGEHTGLYALIFTLAVLPLGVFAIGAFKKRRRGAV